MKYRNASNIPHGSRRRGPKKRYELQNEILENARKLSDDQNKLSIKKKGKNLVSKAVASVCTFYCRYGNCNYGTQCQYLHDPSKVSLCEEFLSRGSCTKSDCCLQHSSIPELAPVCIHFQNSNCTRENCPYQHRKVLPNEKLCPKFSKGYCKFGLQCAMVHSHISIDKLVGKKLDNGVKSGEEMSVSKVIVKGNELGVEEQDEGEEDSEGDIVLNMHDRENESDCENVRQENSERSSDGNMMMSDVTFVTDTEMEIELQESIELKYLRDPIKFLVPQYLVDSVQ